MYFAIDLFSQGSICNIRQDEIPQMNRTAYARIWFPHEVLTETGNIDQKCVFPYKGTGYGEEPCIMVMRAMVDGITT